MSTPRTAEPREWSVPARTPGESWASRVSRTTLEWVDVHRVSFRLPDDVLAPYANVNRTLKPLGELAQLSFSIRERSAPGSERLRRASALLDFAWEQTGRGQLFLDLQRGEPFTTYPLEIYAPFASAGLRHPGFEEVAATVSGTRGWARIEQEPNRRLGVLNSERRVGLPPYGQWSEAYARTWLGGLPEPWTFERTAGYGLTHVVFHLTDWGNAPQRMPAELGRYLAAWLPAWVDTCLEAEQWDLSCELLAVAACVPDAPSYSGLADTVEAAWARIAAVQDAAGGFPEIGSGRPDEPPRDFANCYHSTLVGAFGATLSDVRLAAVPGGAA
ncbi:hypothetical protein OG875_19400 [Streptomyces sp. NBC_01498]|uniref:DUF6895 family protein n=1 Tax=Streptomyces sp. NBC_01498 TaxID=2975870 RepID=UPI002E7B4BFF|nr:hypothetical protein [Streptomyces sp. NBC_01498]WTL26544.1 hypothetical protein OG875_19400 [Streptomyces sp. NBC_01498]